MKKTIHSAVALLLCVAMLFCITACGDKKTDNKEAGGDTKVAYESETELDAVKYGCDNTGKTDVTEKLIALHKEAAEKKKAVYYPNGTYLFNGDTLDFSGGVRFESQDGVVIRNSISETPVVNFDNKGNLIGLMQNHLERTTTGNAMTGTEPYAPNGSLVSPPLSTASFETTVDFVPYWYNDFGRQSTLANAHSWNGWFDWRWNFHGCENLEEGYDPYDPTRHPLLGWYRGDDPVVLDWQCYWLREHGIKNAILMGCPSLDTWEDPTNGDHWVYQLMNHTPNAKGMGFGFWSPGGHNEEDLTAAWWKVFEEFYWNDTYKDSMYCMVKDGKRYPVMFIWDEQNDITGLLSWQDFYAKAADAMKAHGYDGIAIFARNAKGADDTVTADLAKRNVLRHIVAYPDNCVIAGANYTARVDSFLKPTNTATLFGVSTGGKSHTPHPSNWGEPGYNPTDFGRWIATCIKALDETPAMARTITCYNMSEWAEGGPGLVPTVADGFAYLEAIRDNIVKK